MLEQIEDNQDPVHVFWSNGDAGIEEILSILVVEQKKRILKELCEGGYVNEKFKY